MPTLSRLRAILLRPGVRFACVAILALGVVVVSSEAFARAGGGENYRSGGGSSSSRSSSRSSGSSSSSGDGADLVMLFRAIWWLLELTFSHPFVMIPIWIVIGVVIYIANSSTPSARTGAGIDRVDERRLRPDPDVTRGLDAIQRRDPAFNETTFLQRVERSFLEVQEGWFLRRLDRARALLSDGVFRRFTVLQKLMEAEGRRDAVTDVKVLEMKTLRVGLTPSYDIVSVLVRAKIRDVEVKSTFSDAEAKTAAANGSVSQFTEIWTFLRRPTAKTRDGYDASQGRCPNCGAGFTGGASNKCEYCNAVVNSGNFDWVLSEITQESEYLPHGRGIPGIQGLHASDPDAAPEILEDRALVTFWKWLEASAFGKPDLLRSLASKGYFETARDDVMRQAESGVLVKLPAVGGADVVAVETDVDGLDRVHVDIRWSAALAKEGARAEARPRRHVLTLVRKTGAKTRTDAGLATEHCGNCGAPLTNTDSRTCDYCGHEFASGETDWVIDALVAHGAWVRPAGAKPMTQAMHPAFATAGERERILQIMACIAAADGVVDRTERKLLRGYAMRWKVEFDRVEPFLSGTPAPDLRDMSPARADEVLATLVEAAKVDGRVDASERRLLENATRHLQIPSGRLEALLAA